MHHSSPRKVYYQKNRTIYIIMAAGLAVLGAWIAISLHSIAIAILYILVIAFIYVIQTVRIVTSPNGISYYNMGVYAIHSAWENVDRIDLVDFRLLGKQRCILLKNGVKLGPWTDLAWGLTREQRGRTIPIPRFFGFRNTDKLLQDIKRYAPQVTGQE